MSKITSAQIAAQQAWQTPTLGTGWAGWDAGGAALYGFPQYMKDTMGFVHVRGLCKFTTGTATSSNIIFTFPAGYRPAWIHRTTVLYQDTASQVEVRGDGTIYLAGNATATINNWLSLNGITFLAEN